MSIVSDLPHSRIQDYASLVRRIVGIPVVCWPHRTNPLFETFHA